MTRPTRRDLLWLGAAGVLAGCAKASTAARPAARPAGTAAGSRTAGSRTATGAPAAPTTVPTGAAPAAGGPAVEVVHASRTRDAVALTFHGAGDPSLARALLAEAENGGARVTVFAVGSWLEANPTIARRVLDGGHALANHTYTHPNLRALSPGGVEAEFARARDVIVRLSGGTGGYARPSQMDHATPTVLAAAGRAGYHTCVSYDVDPSDYLDPGSALVRQRVLARVRPGSVVSLHLGHQGTVTALPGVLDGLRSRGLAAVTVAELLA